MTEDTAVKVCVRVRPLIEREKSATGENAQPPTLHWKADNNSVHQVEDGTSGKSFSFDHVFTACESTNQLYQAIAKPLVVSTVQGYNGTIFAYGQTSSGKTFTMMGCDKTPGVLPLAVEDVFQTIQNCPKKEFLLRVSYMEIYNETVTDLLVDSWKRKPLEVRETINKNIYVADLTEELVTSPAQALHWIRLGEKNRHYGKTKINQRSSRSHTIFRMILESRERSDSENADGAIIVSHLNLVDLAGSERASQTGAEGARFKEGCNINLSLFTLGQVIKKLTDESQKGFINYRDSKLTRILQNSLGGNAKTVIICTITLVTFDETLSTLQFASTAKKMKNDPHVTEVSDDGALLKRYRNEITDLKRRLLEVSSETQTTATEKELLSQLLQEKDQLQREQEDRIRNLTNLLVSSNSNIATARPVPKRRVTWGGPMLKLASGSSAASELSLTEASTKKRKANSSCIELEADEEFYPHWEILDEAPEDMDSSHVTACSFGDSPKDVPPDHLRELCEKMSMLEQQLEMERHQRSDAQSKVIALELQLQEQLQQRCKTQLEDVEQMKRQFSEAIQLCESLASEKDLLVTERNYLKEELGMSLEQIKTLEKETADLSQELEEKRELDEFEILEEQINKGNEDELHEEISQLKIILESSEQKCQDLQKEFKSLSVELKKKCDFIEELQKMNGKDLVEEVTMLRRSLDDAEMISLDTKKEWACLRSQNMTLEDKNVILTLDNEKNEKDAMSLRSQLEMEKAKYKKMQFDLQKELNIAFEENIKLSSLLDGKVPKNLIDNVELERSVAKLNKKLASCHEANSDLQLKLEQEHQVEMNEVMTQLEENEHLCVCLTVELHELHQLKRDLEEKLTDCEKSRRADKDIQKELEEHVQQLTAELQSVQAQKEAAMGECESRLQSVCSERDVPQQRMDQELVKWQLEKGTESCVEVLKEERDQLKADLKENIEMMIEIQEEVRVLQEKNLKQKECIHKLETAQIQVCVASEAEHLKAQIKSLEEELQHVEADRGRSTEEMDELVSRLSALTGEREQLQRDLDALTQDRTHMKQEMQRIVQSLEQMLQEQNQKNLDLERLSQDRLTELERQTKELQRVEADSRRSTEELVSRVSALTEEREQLQQALDALSKNQQLLDNRTHMEQLQNELNQAETQEYMAKLQQEKEELQASLQTVRLDKGQLESELQKNVQKMKTLEEELQRVEAVHGRSTEEMEALVSRVSALTEDRKQLQQALDAVTQEDNSTDLLQVQITQLNESVQSVTEQKNRLEQELLLNKAELQASLQTVNADKSQLESDLQQNMQKLDEMQRRVQSLEQMLQEQNHKDLERLSQDRLTALARQTKDLQRVEADSRRSTEELVSRVSALTEEREQLQQAFDALIQEKQQLLDNRTHMEQLQNELNQEIQEYMAKLQQEKEELQTVRADKSQLESDLQKYMQKMKTLEEELQRVEAVHGRSTEEMEELVSRVSALTEDQDQLQQALDALTQEKQQLQQHLDSKTDSLQVQIIQLNECVQSVTEQKSHLEQELHSNIEKVSQFDELLHKLQEEKRSLEEKLHNNMETMSRTQQLLSSVQEELCEQKRINRELSQMHSTLNQQSLSKDKQTICDLKEQMSFAPEELLLDASNLHLQESFNKFKKVINVCGDNMSMNLKMVLPAPSCLSSLPKHTIESINTVNNVCVQALKILSVMAVQLHKSALSFQQLFEDLLKKDLAVFEEQRLQDVLLCRALAPSFSIKHMDFVSQWKLRLKELLEKRQLYLQKLDSVVDRMQNVYYREGFSEIQEMKRYEATQQAICASEPVDVSALDSFLDAQLQLRNTMIQKRNSLLEAITEEHGHLLKELSQQAAQAQALLEEEKSKRFTLQHGLEEAPLKTEASLLKDILELQDHLRIAKDQLQIATLEKEELQKAQVKAEHQVSCHKKATQLLQTELQDTRAKLQESERSIEELRSRRQPCETEVTSANVEKLKSKVSKLEMELQAAAEKYNQDIQKLTSVLEGKTTSLRRLKETLRSQQEKDQQYLEGEALHARLVQPKGLVQTHVLLEKSKLEEETRQLKLRVTELESLVTSLQADVAKWKQRALKMKSESEAKSKRGLQAGFECTPPKRQRCDSPRKALDSPALSLLNSPKSRFFDGASSSEFLAKNCPKQFFDNSGLGTPPVEGGSKPDWLEWPLSPKEDQICKKQ